MAKLLMPARYYNSEVFDYLKSLVYCADIDENAAESEIEKIVQKAPVLFSQLKLANVEKVVKTLKELYGTYPEVLNMIKKSITPLALKPETVTKTINFFTTIYGQEYLETLKETPSNIICSPNKYEKLANALSSVLTKEEIAEFLKSFNRVKWPLFYTSTKYDLEAVNEVLLQEYSREDVKKILFNSNTIYSRDVDFYVQLFSQLKGLTRNQQQDFKTKLLNNPDSILNPIYKKQTASKKQTQKTGKTKAVKTSENSELDEDKTGLYGEDLINRTKGSESEARMIIEAYLKKSKINFSFLDEEFKGILKNYQTLASSEKVGQHMELVSFLHSNFGFSVDTLKALTIMRSCYQARPLVEEYKRKAKISKNTYHPDVLLTCLKKSDVNDVVLKGINSSARKLASRIATESGHYIKFRYLLNDSCYKLKRAFNAHPELAGAFPEIKLEFASPEKAIARKDQYFVSRGQILACALNLRNQKAKELETYDEKIFFANHARDYSTASELQETSNQLEDDVKLLSHYVNRA